VTTHQRREAKPFRLSRSMEGALERMEGDCRLFLKQLSVLDKDLNKMVPLVLREEQEELLGSLLKDHKIIVSKGRQIGATTVFLGWFCWRLYFTDEPLQFIIQSFKEKSVGKLIRVAKRMLASLPKWMRRHKKAAISNTQEISYLVGKDSYASIYGYTARGEGGARSDVAAAVLLTEFAYYADQSEVLAGSDALIGVNGHLIIETTAKQPGDIYHGMVVNAARGIGDYVLKFFSWKRHKRYRREPPLGFTPTPDEVVLAKKYGLTLSQLCWRRAKILDLGGKVAQFRREYPLSVEDAFSSGEGTYFQQDVIDSLKVLDVDENGYYALPPVAGMPYVIGADPSGGVGQDFSAYFVLDIFGALAFYWSRNDHEPAAFAEQVARTAEKYNNAMVLVESNNHGHLVLDRLMRLNIRVWRDNQGKHWTTTEKSKMYAYDSLSQHLKNSGCDALPQEVITELASLVVPPGKKNPEAPKKGGVRHDDAAVALALSSVCWKKIQHHASGLDKTQSQFDRYMSSLDKQRRQGRYGSAF